MMEVANRLHSVEEYYFSKKLKEVNALKAAGKPIINLGIGSPDLKPSSQVIDALTQALVEDNAHKYQSYQGLPEFRETIAKFYDTHYNVQVNPDSEVLPLMGSKEGIMHVSMAFLNEGDGVLIPNPGYPTYAAVTKLVQAKAIPYNLDATNNWLPDLAQIETQDLTKVKLMWISYPHMPTGAKANFEDLKQLVVFAKKHNILLVNDNPYSFILNQEPLSLLSIPGAKEVSLEFNSLSKTFNIAGWRVGMVLGSPENIQSVLKVKSNMDSGMFYGIQKGAIAALNSPQEWFDNLNKTYAKRRELVWQLADKLKCTYNKNASGLFVWAKTPKGYKSEQYIDQLLHDKNLFITPGTIFGSQGEGYVRFSLCATLTQIEEAIARV
ncbi:aminotransferase class I/II-fold pyridoxal phosphate-dependent enzyme [Olleya aquimaris]|uniref:Aminotransferase n=1 Tax=Olleya sediminilitoris TaxID=2795739 RepID=A0ABS1WJ51_9FLAO|nr:aminotransferase class I/II-fold pyridoxal phosphate-dependent enzyme [Olleya sediminilitoris]AXO81234.1 aminotransferase class I/II-fold pyridoxal phosphate-dependent enzyme [Olleya aquimaris]MBL7559156.1 aminotransferase class I/II-fold pyridoxal phosphate-dependent enzyme [Olleya sediminilitoris]